MRGRIAFLAVAACAAAFLATDGVRAGDDARAATVADLVDELRDADPHVREVARRSLVALGDAAVPALVEVLLGTEPKARREAVQVLSDMGPVAVRAVPALSDRVVIENGPARLPFLRALGEIDPAGSAGTALPVVLAFLDDRDAAVRIEAAGALRAFGPAAARLAPEVLRKLPSADAAVRGALLDAVRGMGVDVGACVVDLFAAQRDAAGAWLLAVVSDLGETVVPAAVTKLGDPDRNVRAAAAAVLGAAGGAARGAGPQLAAALRDDAGVVRRRAAQALGAVGADARVALPALVALLRDPAGRAEVDAAAAIGRVAVASAVPSDDAAPHGAPVARAIDAGLDWLARHQAAGESGGWDAAGFRTLCPKGAECGGAGETVNSLGVTGLATLAFLGAGETHQSGPHRANVMRAVQLLRQVQDADGCVGPRSMKHWVYFHGIAATALAEDYRATQSAFLKAPAARALDFVRRAQNPYLAWRYGFPADGDNDTSVTGWMTRALAAGRRAGFEHDPGAFRGALAWVDKMTDPATGRTGYQERGGPPARTSEMLTRFPPAKSEALTASALCIRLDAGQDVRGEASRASVALVASRPPVADDPGAVDLYAWFHATDALRRVGGAVWEDWRRALIATLLPRQQTAKAGCARGSFAPDDPWGDIGGRVYSTAMSVLCLELSGTSRQKPAQTAEVRAAVAALTDATASGDDAVKSAAEAALADIRAAYR